MKPRSYGGPPNSIQELYWLENRLYYDCRDVIYNRRRFKKLDNNLLQNMDLFFPFLLSAEDDTSARSKTSLSHTH